MQPKLFGESTYSFQGSNLTLSSMVSHAKRQDFSYLVLTDTTMHAAYKFYQSCSQNGLKPVIGLQIMLEPAFTSTPLHVVGYARNRSGYEQLLQLASVSAVYGEIKLKTLKKHQKNVSFVVDAASGEFKTLVENENISAQKTALESLQGYVETLYLGYDVFEKYSHLKIDKIPFTKACYHETDDLKVYKVLEEIMQKTKRDLTGFTAFCEPDHHTNEEAMKKIKAFLDVHALSIDFAQAKLPAYPTPKGVSSERYLRALSVKGLGKRLDKRKDNNNEYRSRLEKELKIINELGYDDYFLIIWDVIKYARSKNILVGPGRGSAPGSLVAYALGITSIDPLAHGLLFERFLNAARQTMPDIDIDFPDHSRDEVVRYTRDRFGEQYVALICTFGTFLSKSALRDSARVLSIDKKYVDEMIRKISQYDTIAEMLKQDADVQNRMRSHDALKEWLFIASRIESLPRHVSTHAAGLILSEQPLIRYTAIQPGLNTLYQTQYEQADLEAMGLLKMDFLGLRNLSMIEAVLALIEHDSGKTLDVHHLPLDDKHTFKMLRQKSTTGIFQLESAGMRKLIKDMQIKDFNDIQIVLALYRPGPMESIPRFLNRRFNKEKIKPIAKEVDEILAPTQGILLYQEQIMAIAVAFAGYSFNEADILRRAVSKKDAESLELERKNFVKNALNQGKPEKLAHEIYDYIVKFANYGFNKSHSVAYGLIAYWMAYLKANYPAQFIAVLMQNALNNADLMRHYIQEMHEYGLRLGKPSIHKSGLQFHKEKDVLHYPLLGIKNLGKSSIKAFMEIRSSSKYTSFSTFVKATRTIFNRRHLEFLIYAGACDDFKLNKKTMIENLSPLLNFLEYDESLDLGDFVYTEYPEYDPQTLKKMESDAIGFNIDYDDFKPFEPLVAERGYLWPTSLEQAPTRKTITIIGKLTNIKVIETKTKKAMAFVQISDRITDLDAVCFPDTYEKFGSKLEKGLVLLFNGMVRMKDDRRQFILDKVSEIDV